VAAGSETVRAGLEALLAACEDLRVVPADSRSGGRAPRAGGFEHRRSGLASRRPGSRPTCDVLVVAEGGGPPSASGTPAGPAEGPGLAALDEAVARAGGPAGEGATGSAYGGVPAVVCLSEDPGAATRLAASGPPAWALLAPGAGRAQLAAAVRAVHRGLVVLGPPLAPGWFPSRPAGATADGPRGGPAGATAGLEGGSASPTAGAPRDRPEREEPRLTPREREVLALLAQGLGNKQIAWELSVSEHTVKYHVSALYAKLGAASRTEALRLGIERGLLSL
jgi:two-component system nitrate/nitrite response regulator NarL